MDSIPGSGRSPGGGNSNSFQYSCLVGYSTCGHKESDVTEHTTKGEKRKREKNPAALNLKETGDFLVVQWLRLCAPNSGTQVPSLVGELDPTCSSQKKKKL